MRDSSYNIKRICVLVILALTVLNSAVTAVAAAATSKILITEIFPNPKGKDKNNEWIEIFNNGNKTVNLDGWQISQTSGKKTEKFQIKNLKINAKSYAVISGKNLKKSLRNKENALTLLTPADVAVVKIYYKTSKEEKSLSLTKIIDTAKPDVQATKKSAAKSAIPATKSNSNNPRTEFAWLFTSPTKGEKNKDFYYLEGEITGANNKTFTFSVKQNGFLKPTFKAKSLPGQTLTIHYKNINTFLLKIFSEQKTLLKILITKEDNKSILIKMTTQ